VNNQSQSKQNRGDFLAALSKADAKEQANCFRINGTGILREGVEISINHPLGGGNPALFVGEQSIRRHYTRGCFYRPSRKNYDEGIVRRMDIETMSPEGRKSFDLLVRPKDDASSLYVQIDTSIPGVVNFKKKFWDLAVVNGGDVVIHAGSEWLVRLNQPDSVVDIFYPDGSVRSLVRKGRSLLRLNLDIETQARKRIDQAKGELDRATKLEDVERIRLWNSSLDELTAILAVSPRFSTKVFDEVFDFLKSAAENGVVWGASKTAILGTLSHSPARQLIFGMAYDVGMTRRKAVKLKLETGNVVTLFPAKDKSPPGSSDGFRERQTKLTARRLRDAGDRDAIKRLPRPGKAPDDYGKNCKKKNK
jgi:hypothetical protein